jgi:hypothetical protein
MTGKPDVANEMEGTNDTGSGSGLAASTAGPPLP